MRWRRRVSSKRPGATGDKGTARDRRRRPGGGFASDHRRLGTSRARAIFACPRPIGSAGFAERLQQTRLIGPLLAAAASGEAELSPELEADLVERQHRALLWCIHLEVRLLEVREWFDAAGGIRHLVIKGPAVAHLDALDPSVRTFADIDLLVAGDDIDRAVDVLQRHETSVPWAERRPGFDRRFAKSTTRTFADGVELDLHRTLADGVHGHRIPLDRLFEHPDRFEIGGVPFGALSPTHRLLHAAYHLLLGSANRR